MLRITFSYLNFKRLFYSVLLLVTVLFLLPVPQSTETLINDKVAHVLIFFALSYLFDRAYAEYKSLFSLASVLALYGLLIEIAQGYSGYRMFSWFDFGADILGVFSYILLFTGITKQKLVR